MMNDDALRNIEYLREKADVSYEEAAELLTRFDGNVMRVLVELERQGRVYQQENTTFAGGQRPQENRRKEQPTRNVESLFKQAMRHRLVIEGGSGEKKETIANLSAPFCAGAAIVAPHLALGSVALMFVMGYRVKIKKRSAPKFSENVEDFVDKAVSNIKKTASSLSETMQDIKPRKDHDDHHDDDDDEGGEITIE